MYFLITVIICIYLLNVYHTRRISYMDSNLIRTNIRDTKYRTGDVIFFRKDYSHMFKGDNGVNYDLSYTKRLVYTFEFLHQNCYYSHCAIVIIINGITYLTHLTEDPYYDNVKNIHVLGAPSLIKLTDIENYKGFVYHYKYNGPEIKVTDNMINRIYSIDMKLSNFLKSTICSAFKLYHHSDGYGSCCDYIQLVMYEMGLVDTVTKRCDLRDILDTIKSLDYSHDATILETIWIKVTRQ